MIEGALEAVTKQEKGGEGYIPMIVDLLQKLLPKYFKKREKLCALQGKDLDESHNIVFRVESVLNAAGSAAHLPRWCILVALCEALSARTHRDGWEATKNNPGKGGKYYEEVKSLTIY